MIDEQVTSFVVSAIKREQNYFQYILELLFSQFQINCDAKRATSLHHAKGIFLLDVLHAVPCSCSCCCAGAGVDVVDCDVGVVAVAAVCQ